MTSDQEKAVLNHLADAWNGFTAMPSQHPDDVEEFRRGIHACQAIIACRIAQRVDPETWPMRGGDP